MTQQWAVTEPVLASTATGLFQKPDLRPLHSRRILQRANSQVTRTACIMREKSGEGQRPQDMTVTRTVVRASWTQLAVCRARGGGHRVVGCALVPTFHTGASGIQSHLRFRSRFLLTRAVGDGGHGEQVRLCHPSTRQGWKSWLLVWALPRLAVTSIGGRNQKEEDRGTFCNCTFQINKRNLQCVFLSGRESE